jgi:hypothetical protein
MDTLIHVLAYVLAIAIGTALFVASLWIFSDKSNNLFAADGGALAVWLKSLALVTAVQLLTLVPLVGCFLVIFVWFGGIMLLFQQSLAQSLLISVINWGLGFFLALGLGWLLGV